MVRLKDHTIIYLNIFKKVSHAKARCEKISQVLGIYKFRPNSLWEKHSLLFALKQNALLQRSPEGHLISASATSPELYSYSHLHERSTSSSFNQCDGTKKKNDGETKSQAARSPGIKTFYERLLHNSNHSSVAMKPYKHYFLCRILYRVCIFFLVKFYQYHMWDKEIQEKYYSPVRNCKNSTEFVNCCWRKIIWNL